MQVLSSAVDDCSNSRLNCLMLLEKGSLHGMHTSIHLSYYLVEVVSVTVVIIDQQRSQQMMGVT